MIKDEKIQPQSIEAEMAVIGAMLLDKEAVYKAVETLSEDAFYKVAHRKIYSAILDLFEHNEPVDLVTLTNELRKKGELSNIGGPLYLTTILNSVPTAANVEYYIRIVNEKVLLRQIINGTSQILDIAYQPVEDISTIKNKIEETMGQILMKSTKNKWSLLKDDLHNIFESIEKMQQRKGVELSTGFFELDEMIAGLHRGELLIIAGHPGHGKTSLALGIAYNIAQQGKGVAFFSIEMSKENIEQRLICSIAGISFQQMRAGYLKDEDWNKLTTTAVRLSEMPIYFIDNSSPTSLEIISEFRSLILKTPINVLIVDYLQRIGHNPKDNMPRVQQVSYDVRMMKQIAREFNIPVILLSSLRRQENERKEPTLAMLRESGEIESEADTVLMIHREEVCNPTVHNEGIARVLIEKQRNGPTGEVKLAFIKKYCRFENLYL